MTTDETYKVWKVFLAAAIVSFIVISGIIGSYIAKDIKKSRIGQKIEYWLSEPNERTVTPTN